MMVVKKFGGYSNAKFNAAFISGYYCQFCTVYEIGR